MHDRRRAKCIRAFVARCIGLTLLTPLALLLALALSTTARADRYVQQSRTESARGVALGSGARATAFSTQAQADNPANLVVGNLYQIESFLAYDPTFKRFGWGGTVVDSMTSRLAAGFSLRTLFGDNRSGENSGYDGRISLAFPIVPQLSVGVAGRYANMKVADTKAYPENIAMLGMEGWVPDRQFRLKGFTMDAAVTLRPVPGLAISGLAYNMVDRDSPLAPLMVGGSAGFSTGSLTIGGDVLFDLNKNDLFDGTKMLVGGGIEYMVGGLVPLRAGYQYDAARAQNAISGGLGFVDPRFALQASFRQTVSHGNETSLFFAAQYFVK